MKYVMYDDSLDWIIEEDSIQEIKRALGEIFDDDPETDFGGIYIVKGEVLRVVHKHNFEVK